MLVSPYVSLKYVNTAGKDMGFNFFTTFVCESCEEVSTNQVHSIKQAGTHGQFFTGMSMEERHIRLTGTVRHGLPTISAVQLLHNVFNPTISGTLYYENCRYEMNKEINCRAEELPQVYWSGGHLRFDVRLIALEPFWKGKPHIENIAETERMFFFATSIPHGGKSFAVHHGMLESTFDNVGNVESDFIAILRARYGSVTNPEIRNEETGERIRVLVHMRQHDELIIHNGLQEKRVELNGKNAFRHMDAENTTFFRIAVGKNRIGYRADQNASNLVVHVRYIPLFTFAEGQLTEPPMLPSRPSQFLAVNQDTGRLLVNPQSGKLVQIERGGGRPW